MKVLGTVVLNKDLPSWGLRYAEKVWCSICD